MPVWHIGNSFYVQAPRRPGRQSGGGLELEALVLRRSNDVLQQTGVG